MSWDYSGDPSASPKDQVRFLLGDTNSANPRLSDEEIAFALQECGGNAQFAAIRCCESIIAKLSGARDESVGSVSISFSQQAKGFSDLLALLQRRYGMGANFSAYAGGVSYADKARVSSNPDWVRPAFKRGDVSLDGCGGDDWTRSHWEPSR